MDGKSGEALEKGYLLLANDAGHQKERSEDRRLYTQQQLDDAVAEGYQRGYDACWSDSHDRGF